MNTSLTNKTLTAATVAIVCMTLALAGTASAALLVATDLNTDGTDTGFSGGWAGSRNRMPIQAPDLTYANYNITQTGSPTYVYGGDNTHPDRMDSRDLESAMSGEIWFTVMVNVPEAGGFAGLSFHSDTVAQSTAYSHNLADLRVVMSPSELWVDWEGAAVNADWTPDATAGSFAAGTHLLLGQMNIVSGNDTLNVWVDPDLTVPLYSTNDLPAATYSNTGIDFTDSIVRIGLPIHVGGEDTADAIRLSNTSTAFEDVTGVALIPEPSTAIFAMLGMAGIFMRRRPRK